MPAAIFCYGAFSSRPSRHVLAVFPRQLDAASEINAVRVYRHSMGHAFGLVLFLEEFAIPSWPLVFLRPRQHSCTLSLSSLRHYSKLCTTTEVKAHSLRGSLASVGNSFMSSVQLARTCVPLE